MFYGDITKFSDEDIDSMMEGCRIARRLNKTVHPDVNSDYDTLLVEKVRRLNAAPGAEAARKALQDDAIARKPVAITPKMFEHMWNLYR